MKVHSIARSVEANTRERSGDQYIVRRNPDPALHPFERAREYVRALNAVKMERMFAKPFVANFAGHRDGIYALAADPHSLTRIVSGSADGDLRIWDLRLHKCARVLPSAHSAFIRSLVFCPSHNGQNVKFLSASDDHMIKLWGEKTKGGDDFENISTYRTTEVVLAVDHHRKDSYFMSSGGSGILEWIEDRSEPIRTFRYSSNDSYSALRINPSQGDLFVAAGTSDRSIVLGDRRALQAIAKTTLATRTNALAWNPIEPFEYITGNDDGKVYSFDMRRPNRPLSVFVDHVAAVMSLDYAPTGQSFVTGSYDKTIRIFDTFNNPNITVHSRDVYHTMRMQRVWSVAYSADANYLLSGSDDGNVRLWKARADRPVGPIHRREAEAMQYKERLIERFKEMPEVKRISRHRHLPKEIKSRTKVGRIHDEAVRQKANKRITHCKSKESLPNPLNDIVIH